MRRHIAAGILAPVMLVALLSGCAETPAAPQASTAPTASATEEPADTAATPDCDNLWTADLLDRAKEAQYTLNTEWSGATEAEGFTELVPFAENGGVVCIWGNPAFPEQPVAYAWSPIDAAQAQEIQSRLEAEGAIRTEVAGGVVFAQESTLESGTQSGYLFRDGDWFFSTGFPDLEPMAARYDAL